MDTSPRGLVLLAVTCLLVGVLVPIGLNGIFGADTASWDTGSVALWSVLAVVILAGVILAFVPGGSKGSD